MTVARRRGFDSRATIGLRAPRSISRNVDASELGLTGHYGGGAQGLPVTVEHVRCRRRVRDWQAFHMDSRGWADIAYNFLVCQHGIVMAGRGAGIRSAANGSNTGNYTTEAAAFLLGGSEQPSHEAREAFAWIVAERRKAGAAWGVWPHRRWTGSICPGSPVMAFLETLNGRPIGTTTTPPEDDMPTAREVAEETVSLLRGQRFNYYHDGKLPDGSWPTERFDTMISRIRSGTQRTQNRVGAYLPAEYDGPAIEQIAAAVVKSLPPGNQVTAKDVAAELIRQLADDGDE